MIDKDNLVNVMKLNGQIEMIFKSLNPLRMVVLKDAERSTRQYEVIIVLTISLPNHNLLHFIDQPEVHATHYEGPRIMKLGDIRMFSTIIRMLLHVIRYG